MCFAKPHDEHAAAQNEKSGEKGNDFIQVSPILLEDFKARLGGQPVEVCLEQRAMKDGQQGADGDQRDPNRDRASFSAGFKGIPHFSPNDQVHRAGGPTRVNFEKP